MLEAQNVLDIFLNLVLIYIFFHRAPIGFSLQC